MARTVNTLPDARHHTNPTNPYPWDDWMNGQVWLIDNDDISHTNADSFILRAWHAAKRRGMRVKTRKRAEGVYIQAFKDGDDG